MHISGAASLLLPRHREAASRAIAYFLLIGGTVIGACTALPGFAGDTAAGRWATLAVAGGMLLVGAASRWVPDRLPNALWVAVPFIAAALVATLGVITEDRSIGGHLYFLWPVLYAALYLRRAAVFAVLGSVFVGDAVLLFSLSPASQATADLVVMVTALSVSTLVVLLLRERADRLVDALEIQALTDPLTGLSNRRAFTYELEVAAACAMRTGEPLSLVTVDVDRFKGINDRYGHPAGDAVLQGLAGALGAAVRRDDITARLGGDEFVALLHSGPDGAHLVAERLWRAMADMHHLPGGAPTLSIGVASIPEDASSAETLLAASDAALYAAKAAGRNRIVLGRPATEPPLAA